MTAPVRFYSPKFASDRPEFDDHVRKIDLLLAEHYDDPDQLDAETRAELIERYKNNVQSEQS